MNDGLEEQLSDLTGPRMPTDTETRILARIATSAAMPHAGRAGAHVPHAVTWIHWFALGGILITAGWFASAYMPAPRQRPAARTVAAVDCPPEQIMEMGKTRGAPTQKKGRLGTMRRTTVD